MYHSAKKFTTRKKFATFLLAGVLGIFTTAQNAQAVHVTTSSKKLSGNLSIVSSDFPSLPDKKVFKKVPATAQIYQYDDTLLGDRQPFLLVHGLRAEYFPACRWGKLAKKLVETPEFKNKYKLYLIRYDTLARLDITVPQFRDCIARLYQACQRRPISLMSLSLGGNLVYEGMLDKGTADSIKHFFALATMFHGSPLFCENWLEYSIYKNVAFPWTRVDHCLDYRLYFHRNPNLLKDLRWDNCDGSIPEIGHFKSKLPFGPHGELTRENTINDRLIAVNSAPIDHKKIIVYGGYFQNPYMLSEGKRVLENTLLFPYTLLLMKVPAHLAREHPVLNMLNREIATIDTDKTVSDRNKTRFVYQLNDGITPLVSALFIPPDKMKTVEMAKETDIPSIGAAIDARGGRVFRNIDHLTFLDGFHPKKGKSLIRDELHPQQGDKNIFDWLISDIVHVDDLNSQVAIGTSNSPTKSD